MIAIKDIAKKMTLNEFNRRFEEERQGVIDKTTGKIYFCPNDLGFKLTRENCFQGLKCKECWSYAKEHLRENQKLIEKGIR
jgi:hypothetical protein